MTDDSYSDLRQKYNIPYRFCDLMKQLHSVIVGCDLYDSVTINENLLGKAVIDYFEDIDRLKEFEDIERTSVAKIYAHEAYWLIRRKPIQVIDTSKEDERCLFINEVACAFMILVKMCEEKGIKLKVGNPKVKYFYEILFYNLKYRKLTQDSLELMIESFFLGCIADTI